MFHLFDSYVRFTKNLKRSEMLTCRLLEYAIFKMPTSLCRIWFLFSTIKDWHGFRGSNYFIAISLFHRNTISSEIILSTTHCFYLILPMELQPSPILKLKASRVISQFHQKLFSRNHHQHINMKRNVILELNIKRLLGSRLKKLRETSKIRSKTEKRVKQLLSWRQLSVKNTLLG